ncbi:MAG: hypothetical protein R3359_11555, partial [Marinirhabdus sp.]|nr:hypothetical protein [Marinirhabdus sp.]
MEKNYIKKNRFNLLLAHLFIVTIAVSQVGINTTSPEGLLDMGPNSTMGLVYPVTELSDINVATISNPNAANLVAGTCVYNNITAGTGISSVYPGIYIWNGSKWIPQFGKKDAQLASQDVDLRTGSDDLTNGVLGDQTISFDNTSFTPIFSGPYKVTLTLQYGAGRTNDPSGDQHVNYAAGSGTFEFTFNGSTTTYDLKAYSGLNDDRMFKGGSSAPTLVYTNDYNQSTYILEETLTRNVAYPFTLTFNQDDLDGFEGDGDISIVPAGDGRGYIVSAGEFICTV